MVSDLINKRNKKNIAWKRPIGPLNIWRVIEMRKLGNNGVSEPVRLSIQDIPEDRIDEAVNFMIEYFPKEEVTCKALKIYENEDAINDLRSIWNYLLREGVSVGAFVLNSDNSLGELAGMNVLYVATKETGNKLQMMTNNFKSSKLKMRFKFMHGIYEKVNVREIYGVDKYLGSLGLVVKHAFRGQRLGVRLLEARDDIGRKYGIFATATLFMGPSSQVQAERAGLITAVCQEYALVMDINGEPMFPNIEAKILRGMIKELR